MGLNVDNSFSENYEIVCLLGLTVFVLNEFGSTFKLHNQMRNEATRYKRSVKLEHDLVEDG